MWEDVDGLTGFTEFSNELFEPDTIATMVAKFETLLEIVAAQPRASLSDVLTQLGPR